MASIWDSIAASIIKQAEPLIIKYLPEVKRAMKEAVREELESFFGTNPVPTTEPPVDPPPIELKDMVMFDLPQTAIDLNALGYPGYEGEILYMLSLVALGWETPNDPHAGVQAFYTNPGLRTKLEQWYEGKIKEARDHLTANSGHTVTIIANDARDRFGMRIGPPTMERLAGFGDRVQMVGPNDRIVPESEY